MLYVNLISERLQKRARDRVTYIISFSAVVAALGLCLGLVLSGVLVTHRTQTKAQEFERKTRQLEPVANEVKQNKGTLEKLHPLWALQGESNATVVVWMQLLRDIIESTPGNVWIEKMTTKFEPATHAHTVIITGQARTHEDLAAMWRAINTVQTTGAAPTALFDSSRVTLKGTVPEIDREGNILSIGFTISARLKEPVGVDFQ